jgi:hypothetical protein
LGFKVRIAKELLLVHEGTAEERYFRDLNLMPSSAYHICGEFNH